MRIISYWLIKIANIEINNEHFSSKDAENVLEILLNLNSVLDIIDLTEEKLSPEIEKLIKEREARKDKDWATSDRLRDELKEKGILLEDTKDGTIWKKER